MAFSHQANNNTGKPILVFEKAKNSEMEELLLDIHSSKQKIILLSFVGFPRSTIVKPSAFAVSVGLACYHE